MPLAGNHFKNVALYMELAWSRSRRQFTQRTGRKLKHESALFVGTFSFIGAGNKLPTEMGKVVNGVYCRLYKSYNSILVRDRRQ